MELSPSLCVLLESLHISVLSVYDVVSDGRLGSVASAARDADVTPPPPIYHDNTGTHYMSRAASVAVSAAVQSMLLGTFKGLRAHPNSAPVVAGGVVDT